VVDLPGESPVEQLPSVIVAASPVQASDGAWYTSVQFVYIRTLTQLLLPWQVAQALPEQVHKVVPPAVRATRRARSGLILPDGVPGAPMPFNGAGPS
jgi:hypothetical protein